MGIEDEILELINGGAVTEDKIEVIKILAKSIKKYPSEDAFERAMLVIDSCFDEGNGWKTMATTNSDEDRAKVKEIFTEEWNKL